MITKQKHTIIKYLANNKLIFTVSLLLIGIVFVNARDGGPGTTAKNKTVRKVMIDAGHGGHDPGNLCTKRYDETEKDIALEVTLKVGKMIEEKYPDVEVLYTRTTDVFIDLYERPAMANKNDVDLFISIHCDAVGNDKAYGCSSYVIGPAKTEANLKLAQRENASMLKEKNYKENYSGFDPYSPESYIEMSLRQNAHAERSLQFAQLVQDEIREHAERKDRGVKQAPYWVISYTMMPSVLIELGFTTNKEEEDFLRSEKGQKKMSTSIVNAFGKYKLSVETAIANEDSALDIKPQIRETVKEPVKVVEKEVPLEEMEGEVYFKIQIATSSKNVSLEAVNFKGLESIEMYQSGGLYKYTYGKEKNYKKAKSLLKKVKEELYPGAFVVAFKGSKRIDLADALLIQ